MKKTVFIFFIALLSLRSTNILGQKDSSTKSVGTFTVPEINAEYPGGYKQMINYFKENVMKKLSGTAMSDHTEKVIAKFAINENGKVVDAKIFKSSTDAKVDETFLNAIKKMPTWKPAENPKGKKARQEFTLPLNICTK